MDKETADEIVGRALRGEPYVPTGDEDVLVSAQPAAPQGVAYADAHGAIMGAAYDFRDAHISGSPNQKRSAHAALESAVTAAVRASNGQAPATQQAGATKEHVRLVRVIADKIEDGTLFRSGIYSNKDLARFVRNVADAAAPQPSPTAQAAPAAGAVAGPDGIDAIALTRYKVVPSHDSMFHRFAVVAGDGKQQLYLGRETECQNMARKFAGAFLDGAFYQYKIDAASTPAAQADSVPAIQGETNVQLDTDSNHSAPGQQQRDMACSVALGQPMGNGQDQAEGRPSAQGDKLLTVAERNIRSFLRSATFKSESDREAALNCVDVLWEAARKQGGA